MSAGGTGTNANSSFTHYDLAKLFGQIYKKVQLAELFISGYNDNCDNCLHEAGAIEALEPQTVNKFPSIES